ncbi:hypothetical protein [Streptomyces sp. LaPpAH-108]|uniref:hypothetical protein n=1 Tax=Streptomyces sp. LaPpAH-108 TaxID=1155714 RepID=UPI0003A0646E|nr:hypothetical protein [Streptomyces sp. LaPpAH-108]
MRARRSVLGVVHNITSATRLLDLLSVFDGDTRVQVLFTRTGSSALDEGTDAFLAARGMLQLPWDEAISQPFDLAIATNRGGNLHDIPFPLVGAPHGAGYNKRLSRQKMNEHSESGAFGLTDEWLMHDGQVIPSVIILSHAEQLSRLAEGCPQALPLAQVAGDPCLDQLNAGLPFRESYRQALGLLPGQRLVVVSSTWGPGSILDSPHAEVLRRALAELPAEEFRVLAAVHPNSWFGHGAWQINMWLAPLLERGLLLPSPESETWKAALCAADFLIGDTGSLTLYGMELGIPCVLGAFQESVVASGSPMERLGKIIPRLHPTLPLLDQLTRAARVQQSDPELAALRGSVTSEPGRSAALLRRLLYSRLHIPEPAHPATTRAIPLPSQPSAHPHRSPHLRAMQVTTQVSATGTTPAVSLRRFPSGLRDIPSTHLSADPDDPDRQWPAAADVLVLSRERCPLPGELKYSDFSGRFPRCGVVALEKADRGCVILFPDDTRMGVRWLDRPDWADFTIAASAIYAWAQHSPEGHRPLAPGVRISIRAGEDLAPALCELTAGP